MQNTQAAMDHLKNHMTYPATKAQLVAACGNLSDFSPEDKAEFEAKLPEGSYNSAGDVAQALGWPAGEGTGGDSMPGAGGGMSPTDGGQTPPPAGGTPGM